MLKSLAVNLNERGCLFLIAWLSSASHLTGKIRYIFICDWQLVYIVSFLSINCSFVYRTGEANVQLFEVGETYCTWIQKYICIRQKHCSNASLWCSTLLLLQWTDRYTCLLCSNVWPILTFTQTSCAETHFLSNQLFILKTKWSSQWRFKKKPPVDIVFCLTPNGIKYIINTFSESRIPRKYSGLGENKF